jgi:hypothetical protein
MDYQLKPIGKNCSQSGKEFLPGDVCYSAVVEKGNELVRLDFSHEAWKGAPEGAVGYWKCTIPPRAEAKRRAFDPDALLRQFEQLCEAASPAQDKLRYVLALLLIQRRRLRVTATRSEDGFSLLELAGTQGEGPFEVRDHQLDEHEMEALERELHQQLTL